ncbi:transglutaminase family protein [Geobacter pickeringii]|uniref:transglutaminase family protein n=1 Tax=Geobacter pickeringii TaxID=345632 RepID=UPI00068E2718|nr:DUF3488 and transglutaminase-like domain-containing protein [Geobacter pickeringii]
MVRISSVITILAYLVACLGYLPVFAYADPVARAAFPLTMAAGILFDLRENHPCAGVASTVATIGFFIYYAAQLSMANPATPVVNFIVILLAVRLLNEKSPRNLLQIFALALFALASSSLFNLSAIFLVYLGFQLAIIAIALVLLTFHAVDAGMSFSRASLKRVFAVSLLMPVSSVPLILLFFAILPRTQYPLLNFLNTPAERSTGFSESVEPGKVSQVTETRRVALRVECEKLPMHDLYWRGIVLDALAGSTWVRSEHRPAERAVAAQGKSVRQVVYPEPARLGYLLALNVPTRIDGVRSVQASDFVFTFRGAPGGRVRYEALSILADAITVNGEIDRKFYRALPPRISARTMALSRRLASPAGSDLETLARIEEWYRSQRFTYATSGLPLTDDPVDTFLFTHRRGHCELFATSFAVILRLAGIPSRLVGGYYGGDYNDLGGYYLVTGDRAHVWVEAFVRGKGWLRVDPSSFASNFDTVGTTKSADTSRRIADLFDSLTYYWNQAVITYDFQKQFQLVSMANSRIRGVPFRPLLGSIARIALPLSAIGILVWLVRIRGKISQEERLVARLRRRIRKVYGNAGNGLSLGLYELAELTDDPAVSGFAALYGRAVYRDRRPTPDEYRELRRLIDEIGRARGGDEGGDRA